VSPAVAPARGKLGKSGAIGFPHAPNGGTEREKTFGAIGPATSHRMVRRKKNRNDRVIPAANDMYLTEG
jgi:hypothetical protein